VQTEIPDDVTRFISRHIQALDDLDALLLLRRTGIALTAEQVAAELRTSLGSAESALGALARDGIAREEKGGFRYAPAREVAAVVDGLFEAYVERPTRVIALIFSPPGAAGRQNRE
jgi:hypothetical protein